jgi:uncharacterized cupin superfamily protein
MLGPHVPGSRVTGGITHWDEVESGRRERGHIAGTWRSLTGLESETIGVKRITVDPGMWSTPLHLEGSEEEIFYILGGSGISIQSDDGKSVEAFEVGPADCLVHLALEHAHTLQAGDEGLDVLAFGQRHYAANTLLIRAGVSWLGTTWVLEGSEEDHPWTREAAVGAPPVGELSPRPPRIVNVADVEATERETATIGRRVRDLGRAARSERTGLRYAEVLPGKLNAPPHCHSAEEEIFVVLAGSGDLLLWEGEGVSEHPVRAGSAVARRAGTGVAHAFRGGDGGMSLLMYGTRDPNDICFYPRSQKVYFAGLGLSARLGDPLDFWDGED